MNEKRIKELYVKMSEDAAPDMEALWERIDSKLDKKDPVDMSDYARPHGSLKIFRNIAIAACIAFIIILPRFAAVQKQDYAAGDLAETSYETATTNDYETSAALATTITEESGYSDDQIYQNDGGGDNSFDYFVEEDVLVETEVFVDAIVNKVYMGGEDEIFYELNVLETVGTDFGESGAGLSEEFEQLVVKSGQTQFLMKQGGEYISPLSIDGGGMNIVFEDAPQIEVTPERGLVFHNGWRSLEGDGAEWTEYPSSGPGDYFYDRMLSLPEADISSLISKWKSERAGIPPE
jgi:hypothetical protein